MPRFSETDNYKFTLSKHERNDIFQLLIQPDNLESVSGFIKDIDYIFVMDRDFASSRTPTDKQQYEIFNNILDCSDALLGVLKTIRRKDDDICIDVHTACLIYLSRSILVQEKLRSLKELPEENSLHIVDSGIVDFRYPTQLIKSLEEMRDAVAHAAEQVKTKRGNGSNYSSKAIRKRQLADCFVASYQNRFNNIPQKKQFGPAQKAFNLLILKAGLTENNDTHCLRDAINRVKARTSN
jgi:hypothetical protein